MGKANWQFQQFIEGRMSAINNDIAKLDEELEDALSRRNDGMWNRASGMKKIKEAVYRELEVVLSEAIPKIS